MKLNAVFGSFPDRALILLTALILSSAVQAGDIVVIVNKGNAALIDKATVAKIYTGELKSWSDGTAVVAFDLPEDNPQRVSFSNEVVGKPVASLKAIWAQLIFSGTALPPKTASSDDAIKKLVAATKGGVGYINAASADDSVKIAIK